MQFDHKQSMTSRLVELYCIFLYIVEARGRASTVHGSGRNRQKQDAKHACMHGVGINGYRRNLQGGKIGRRRDLGGDNEGRKDQGLGLRMI